MSNIINDVRQECYYYYYYSIFFSSSMSFAKILLENDMCYLEAEKRTKQHYEPLLEKIKQERDIFAHKTEELTHERDVFAHKADVLWNSMIGTVQRLSSMGKSAEEISVITNMDIVNIQQILNPMNGHTKE